MRAMKWSRTRSTLVILVLVLLTIILQKANITDRDNVRFTPAPPHTCQEVYVGVPCWTEEQRRDMPILLKSILHTSPTSLIHLYLVTDARNRALLETLMGSWQLRMVECHILEANDTPDPERMLLSSMVTILTHPVHVINSHKVSQLYIINPSYTMKKDMRVLSSSLATHTTGMINPPVFITSTIQNGPLEGGLLVAVTKDGPHPLLRMSACTGNLRDLTEKNIVAAEVELLSLVKCRSHSRDSVKRRLSRLQLTMFPQVELTDIMEYKSASEEYAEVLQLDGEVFRTAPHPCVPDYESAPTSRKDDQCYEYTAHTNMPHRTHLEFWSAPSKRDPSNGGHEVTLVTQLHTNRLRGLERMLAVWDGPIHAVIYLSDTELPLLLAKINTPPFKDRPNVVIHLVFRRWKYYPINYLRNIGLNQVTSRYLITLDADFVTSPGMAANIFDKMEQYKRKAHNVALIVPAYQTFEDQYRIAQTKTLFLTDLSRGAVITYHAKAVWKDGHRFVDYERWKNATAPYTVKNAFGFEPYIALPTEGVLMYQELLIERQRDKLLYTVELELAGVDLVVSHDLYTVHMPHEDSVSEKHKQDPLFETCARLSYKALLDVLQKKYGTPEP